MDAVILAAGKNARLLNYMPAFHKPLLPSGNGLDSLLRNAVRLAQLYGVERPVIVASPINAYEINKDLDDLTVDMVIQRYPTGPGDALRLGLAFKAGTTSDRVLVLLSDNTLSIDDVSPICSARTAIGVRQLPIDEAARFTWYDPDKLQWREKETPPDRLPYVDCWVGPFVGLRDQMETVLRNALPINDEYLIGPYLDELTTNGARIRVSSWDVGTEKSYLDYMKGLRR